MSSDDICDIIVVTALCITMIVFVWRATGRLGDEPGQFLPVILQTRCRHRDTYLTILHMNRQRLPNIHPEALTQRFKEDKQLF